MDKRLRIAGIVGAIIFSFFVLTSEDDPLPLPEPPSPKVEDNSVAILAENLENPRSIAIYGDKIFVTEKEGRVRVIQNNELLEEPLATFRPAEVFDGGLLGITTHPDYADNNFLYVFYSRVCGRL